MPTSGDASGLKVALLHLLGNNCACQEISAMLGEDGCSADLTYLVPGATDSLQPARN